MASPLALSPTAAIALDHFGAEAQPLLVVDHALRDPGEVIAIAARHRYRPIGPFYPGVRAAVSEAVALDLVRRLLPRLQEVFALAREPKFLECYLSIVTTEPTQLAPIQRLPHFDGTGPERIAVLLYLDRSERGGTAFFRHRGTGFESVHGDRFEAFQTRLQSDVARHGLPSGYIGGDSVLFERTHRVEGIFNRMIVYRGNTLHCADLGPEFRPDANPFTGRLTLNLFLR